MQQLHFPEGSAYRSETGGLMKALRELSVDQSIFIQCFEVWYNAHVY
jgi:hypothetical protein